MNKSFIMTKDHQTAEYHIPIWISFPSADFVMFDDLSWIINEFRTYNLKVIDIRYAKKQLATIVICLPFYLE